MRCTVEQKELHTKWHTLGQSSKPVASFGDRAEYGWQVDFASPDSPCRCLGPNGMLCTGLILRTYSDRPDLYEDWCFWQNPWRQKYFLCRNGRDQELAIICYTVLSGHPWWTGSWHLNFRRVCDSKRCDAILSAQTELFDAFFNPLSHATWWIPWFSRRLFVPYGL